MALDGSPLFRYCTCCTAIIIWGIWATDPQVLIVVIIRSTLWNLIRPQQTGLRWFKIWHWAVWSLD